MSDSMLINEAVNRQITKLNNVQLRIKLILESKYESALMPNLQQKYEQNARLVENLMDLSDSLIRQNQLCDDIKNLSANLNQLVEKLAKNDKKKELKKKEASSAPVSPETKNRPTKVPSNKSGETLEASKVSTSTNAPSIGKFKYNLTNLKIPKVTEEEYGKLPRYMVGRITLENINKFVDLLNIVLMNKYELLAKPKSSLKGSDLQYYRNFKVQEIEDTKGKYFLTEGDIAKQQNKKNVDKLTFNMLVILRHIKRIYEHRAAGTLRYILL